MKYLVLILLLLLLLLFIINCLLQSLLQQARNLVSCVVERRRSDEVMDGANENALESNSTDRQRIQRLSGERVAILCESGDPRQE